MQHLRLRLPYSGRSRLALFFLVCMLFVFRPGHAATTIDILLVYDTTATAWVAGNGGMAAFSQDAVNRMNQAMQNSNVDLSFRLVHAMSVNYTHKSFNTDLDSLKGGFGAFSAVHAARNTYGADLVAMLVDTGSLYGTVGLGYLLSSWAGLPNHAFTVNGIRSVNISHTLTHEVGHNLGADHSKYQKDAPGPNPYLDNQYSAGWYFTGTNNTKYHTIMAYDLDGYGNEYQEAPIFSTPLANWQGKVAGDALYGDNSRLIRETMGVVARYRRAADQPSILPGVLLLLLGDSVPGAPTLIYPANGSMVAGTSIVFHWNPVPGATKYYVTGTRKIGLFITYWHGEMNNTTFNMTDFPDDGTECTWKVMAGNSEGWGDWSSMWTFTNGSGGSILSEPH